MYYCITTMPRHIGDNDAMTVRDTREHHLVWFNHYCNVTRSTVVYCIDYIIIANVVLRSPAFSVHCLTPHELSFCGRL
jgi:hypothetical protein